MPFGKRIMDCLFQLWGEKMIIINLIEKRKRGCLHCLLRVVWLFLKNHVSLAEGYLINFQLGAFLSILSWLLIPTASSPLFLITIRRKNYYSPVSYNYSYLDVFAWLFNLTFNWQRKTNLKVEKRDLKARKVISEYYSKILKIN